jgi:hypothetical protein
MAKSSRMVIYCREWCIGLGSTEIILLLLLSLRLLPVASSPSARYGTRGPVFVTYINIFLPPQHT